ncbi:hypothetical protein DEI99_015390 [Curtobacterium sp. MCLR17_036]|uniref:hypothetical protein n=1 Tax=Curtobacterium sp. MCLR17_036 TaxID=2175620 RepID=UPI0015E8878A|nr:hypothetical protein [Curtobacterium sp. MCLR17_036]WIE64594.1 hypothetical protein DEI99_015390 [Curtobacterium sp. MCLR17_036]
MDLSEPAELTAWRRAVDTDLWMLATEDGVPAVIAPADESPQAVALAFLDQQQAQAAAPDDAVLLHTTLWSALRATPADVALLLQPGQPDEEVLLPEDIDRIVGGSRDRAPVLSPRDLAITSMIPAVIVDGVVSAQPDGLPVGVLLDQAGRSGVPLTLAAGPALPLELDAWTTAALIRAASPFPAGFDVVVGAPKPEQYPAVTDFREQYDGAAISTVGVIVERASERIVVVVDTDDADELGRVRVQAASLVPLPVFVTDRRSSPEQAWMLGRPDSHVS